MITFQSRDEMNFWMAVVGGSSADSRMTLQDSIAYADSLLWKFRERIPQGGFSTPFAETCMEAIASHLQPVADAATAFLDASKDDGE